MSNTSSAVDASKEQLVRDFKILVADAESLLKATAGQSGEAVAAMRAKVGESLAVAKVKLTEAEELALEKAKAAAAATDEYVHEHPWHAVGIAAGVGLVIGLLIGRTRTPALERSTFGQESDMAVAEPATVVDYALENLQDGPIVVPPELQQSFDALRSMPRRKAVSIMTRSLDSQTS